MARPSSVRRNAATAPWAVSMEFEPSMIWRVASASAAAVVRPRCLPSRVGQPAVWPRKAQFR